MRFPRIMRAPVFDDEDRSTQAYLLNVVLWTMILVPAPYLLQVLLKQPDRLPHALVLTATGEAVNALLLLLLHRGQVRLASWLQVASLWLFMTAALLSYASGVTGVPYLLGYFTCIVLAGVLLGSPGASAVVLASLAVGGLMVLLDGDVRAGSSFSSTSASTWALTVALFPLVAVIQYLADRRLRLARDRAREAEERARSLTEAAFDGIMVHDRGAIVHANHAFARLFGVDDPAELVGVHGPRTLLSAESQDLMRRRLEENAAGIDLVTGIRRDGSTFIGETQARPVVYGGRPARVVVMRDVTEREHAAQDRAALHDRMEKLERLEMVGRLTGTVAHDFNNLLQAVVGNASLLFERARPDELPLLKDLLQAAQGAASLARRLLTIGRRQAVSPSLLDPNVAIAGVRSMLERIAGKDRKCDFSTAAPVDSVRIDPGQLEQVLVNLCVNARDATAPGGRIEIATENRRVTATDAGRYAGIPPGKYVAISVRDDGIGIEPELLERIFEPFFTTKAEGQGTGLGLASVYGIARQNGGTVAVTSTPGAGSTFEFLLPSASPEA